MFMISYTCHGYNPIKASYIKHLFIQCDILFVEVGKCLERRCPDTAVMYF